MPAHCERLSDQLTAPGTRLRSVPRVDLDHFPTGAFSLIGEDLYELRPTTIGYGFPKMTVLDHTRHVEVFHGYRLEAFHESIRRLVCVVPARTGNLLMRLAKQCFGFLASLRAFLPARYALLRSRQATLGIPVASIAGYQPFLRWTE